MNESLTLRYTLAIHSPFTRHSSPFTRHSSLMLVPFRSIGLHNPLNSHFAPNKRVADPSLVTRLNNAIRSVSHALIRWIRIHIKHHAGIMLITCYSHASTCSFMLIQYLIRPKTPFGTLISFCCVGLHACMHACNEHGQGIPTVKCW